VVPTTSALGSTQYDPLLEPNAPTLVFENLSDGWLVRLDGHGIDKTTDGGYTWSASYRDSTQIVGLDFVNRADGWAITWGESLLRTVDGGQSWKALPLRAQETLVRLDFVDLLRGWAVTSGRALLATTDGGASWIPVETRPVLDVCAAVPNSLWVAGTDGTIYTSADLGRSWAASLLFDRVPQGPGGPAASSPPDAPRLGCSARTVWAQYVWAVGGGSAIGEFERTADAGAHWVATPAEAPYWGIISPTAAWVLDAPNPASATGAITTDDGATFRSFPISSRPDTYVHANDGWFIDARHGWAAVTTESNAGSDVVHQVLATSDGGATWQTRAEIDL
jgi:photosystem II stability/assembly factor-like uncharacterized protein